MSSTLNGCLAAARAGVDTTLVFPVDPRGPDLSPELAALSQGRVRVKTFPVSLSFSEEAKRWGVSFSMAAWLAGRVRNYDIVHVDGTWGLATLVAFLSAVFTGKPRVVSPHETLTAFDIEGTRSGARRLLKKALKPLYVRHASLIVTASRLELMDSLDRGKDSRATVIEYSLPEDRLARPEARRAQRPEPGLTVGFLGRLHPKKNVNILIQTLSTLSSEVTLRIGGTGALLLERRLRDLAAAVGVEDRIEWLGFLGHEDKARFWDSIDVLAMPSKYESFGMVAAEAMQHGVPPIVSNQSGVAELVERHRCGFIAAPTVEAFAAAIRDLLRDKTRLRTLGERAMRAARHELVPSEHGRKLRQEYERLLRAAR